MRSVIAIILILFAATTVYSADVRLAWDEVPGAASYKVQMSTDNGSSWDEERDAGAAASLVWNGAPDTGLLLFRAVACNNIGEAIRYEAGAWYCGDWRLPAQPNGLGVQ